MKTNQLKVVRSSISQNGEDLKLPERFAEIVDRILSMAEKERTKNESPPNETAVETTQAVGKKAPQ